MMNFMLTLDAWALDHNVANTQDSKFHGLKEHVGIIVDSVEVPPVDSINPHFRILKDVHIFIIFLLRHV